MCVFYCCICPNSDYFDAAGGWQLTSITLACEWITARHRHLDSLASQLTDAQSSLADMSPLPFDQWYTPNLLNSAYQLQESISAIRADVISFRGSRLLRVYIEGIADPSFVLEQTVELAADVFNRAARLSLALGYYCCTPGSSSSSSSYWYSLRHFAELTEHGTVVALDAAENVVWQSYQRMVVSLMPLFEGLAFLEGAHSRHPICMS